MKPRATLAWLLAALAATLVGLLTAPANSQIAKAVVALQPTTPGAAQNGNSNITGTAVAGIFQGSGSGLTNLPWSSITGTPGTFPPSGVASGDLTGTYPSPSLTTSEALLCKVTGNTMVSSGGNIGIGVQNPTSRLQVNTSAAQVGVFVGNRTPFSHAAFETDFTSATTHLYFAENGLQVASIGSGGNAFFRGGVTLNGNLSIPKIFSGLNSGAGSTFYFNSDGLQYITASIAGGDTNSGGVVVGDSGQFDRAGMYSSGGQGFLYANVKNFREPNEADPDTDIVYACVEGPEAAAYVRGTGQLVKGRATIDLPEHFRTSCIAEGMTVQLTPRSYESKGLAAGQVSLAGIEVGELQNGTGSYSFDWEVKAVRKGYKNYRPIRRWDEDRVASKMSREEIYRKRQLDSRRFFTNREARDSGLVNP